MTAENRPQQTEIPYQNIARGLLEADMPAWMGPVEKGKVRDSWVFNFREEKYRVMVTTDRTSAMDANVVALPGKGKVLNLLSAFWFESTRDIIPNQMKDIPHPNVLISEQAEEDMGVEVVARRFMAKSSTSTSVYHNYMDLRRTNIYGIDFPKGLRANEEFPMGTIITPTTKAKEGHDIELTDDEARERVDSKFGDGIWDQAKKAGIALFERGYKFSLGSGLIMADTKYEFGIKKDGSLMLIDEVHTPDSSRFWLAESYREKFARGENPVSFDKEIIRRWLAEHGFKGDGPVPVIPLEVIDQVAEAYTVPYKMITGKDIPVDPPSKASNISSDTNQYFFNLAGG